MDRLAVENTDFVPPAHLPFDEVVNSLAGALQAVVALPPSPAASALAKRTLAEVHRIQAAARLSSIIAFVEREFRLHEGDLQAQTRIQRVAFARQVAMFLCRRTGASFPTVAAHFNRDHSTCVHACQIIQGRIDVEPAFRRSIEKLEAQAQIAGAVVIPTTAAAHRGAS
jgi:chromosomal replication initiator protein